MTTFATPFFLSFKKKKKKILILHFAFFFWVKKIPRGGQLMMLLSYLNVIIVTLIVFRLNPHTTVADELCENPLSIKSCNIV